MRKIFVLLLAGSAFSVNAAELDRLESLSQAEFRELGEDLGAAFVYKSALSAEPFGAIGHDVSLGVSALRLAQPNLWRRAGADVTTLTATRFNATKGLPMNFDVGAYFAVVPDAGARVYGAQLRYAVLEGGVGSPALGVSASATRAAGLVELDQNSRSLELAVSQRFGSFTPYAGLGRAWIDTAPAPATSLRDESFALTRTFAGVRFTSLVLQFTVEAEHTGDTNGITANLGFFF